MNQTEIAIRKIFDAHLHGRGSLHDGAPYGANLEALLPVTACYADGAVMMGNLFKGDQPTPIETAQQVLHYRGRISAIDPKFNPVMSVMFTGNTTGAILKEAYAAGARVLKFIPGNASTGGAPGLDLSCLKTIDLILRFAQDLGMVFSCHFERATKYGCVAIPLEMQELAAMEYLNTLIQNMPGLKIVVEHASTREMIDYVEAAAPNVVATLTAHHALLDISEVLDDKGNIHNPLLFCKPIAKRELDRQAVRRAMVSGNPKFFLGSDSAAHPLAAKRKQNPAAGICSAHVLLPLLCKIFEEEDALYRLEDFTSTFAAKFYDLPLSAETITLRKEPWRVPFDYDGVPLFMGDTWMDWKVC